ncbi:MAG: DUF6480 family protein [Motilibacteraceae bacterium]
MSDPIGQRRPDPMDPDPRDTPGLEPGGGVQPGDTPPIAGTTSESAGPTPAPRSRQTPVALAVVIGLCIVIGLLFLVWAFVRASS